MAKQYTDEKHVQILLALLKAHGIRKVIASPGTTNMALVGSMQYDAYFEMYSAVDERSAAYMACGLAAESGEPVVISCTGATASRNYQPGLTEAYYRKLPILAITSTQVVSRVGHHIPQVIDRSALPKDVAKASITLPLINDDGDFWDCEMKVNYALMELHHRGGGPVHINLPTTYSKNFDTKALPTVRVIDRITSSSQFPILPKGRIAIFLGAHAKMSADLTEAVDSFCAANNGVVFCDHTSGYSGRFRTLFAYAACQLQIFPSDCIADLVIHIGEVSGDYYSPRIIGDEVWRVSEDGEIRDTFSKLRFVFEMPEKHFFEYYTQRTEEINDSYFQSCKKRLIEFYEKLPNLPFSNVWVASEMAPKLPAGATIHFGILNSLRSWNMFELPQGVNAASNVGGFGIDGGLSALVGASLANPQRLYFGIIGDLAFFYDMNVLGNRHLGKNLRILLVNNGKGTEFRQYQHPGSLFGKDGDEFIAAAGHFGNKSRTLVKHYAEDLGFIYRSAANKNEFEAVSNEFLTPELTDKPILLEAFTDSEDESRALEAIMNIGADNVAQAKLYAKRVVGPGNVHKLKKILKHTK